MASISSNTDPQQNLYNSIDQLPKGIDEFNNAINELPIWDQDTERTLRLLELKITQTQEYNTEKLELIKLESSILATSPESLESFILKNKYKQTGKKINTLKTALETVITKIDQVKQNRIAEETFQLVNKRDELPTFDEPMEEIALEPRAHSQPMIARSCQISPYPKRADSQPLSSRSSSTDSDDGKSPISRPPQLTSGISNQNATKITAKK